MKIVRRYQPNEERQLEALVLLLRSNTKPAREAQEISSDGAASEMVQEVRADVLSLEAGNARQ